MKKNWMQLLSLGLNIVLLLTVLSQGRALKNLQNLTWRNMDQLTDSRQAMYSQISELSETVKKSDDLVEEFSLTLSGVDLDARALELRASAALRRWSEDTALTLRLQPAGEGERRIELLPAGPGIFAASVSLPVNEGSLSSVLEADAEIFSGGETSRESLDDDLLLCGLLPVQLALWGGQRPEYQGGQLTVKGYSVSLTAPEDRPAEVSQAAFRLYLGDSLAWEAEAEPKQDEAGSFSCPARSADYQPGDRAELRFFCRDRYGLGYEYALEDWRIDGETPENVVSGGGSSDINTPNLIWE